MGVACRQVFFCLVLGVLGILWLVGVSLSWSIGMDFYHTPLVGVIYEFSTPH